MASSLPTRVCKLSKKEGQSFGFFLRIEQGKEGHLIRCIEKGGIGEKAGLKDGDRILKVNETYVDQEEHAKVVELVRNSGNSVTFLVLAEKAYEKAKKKGIKFPDGGQNKPSNQTQGDKSKPSNQSPEEQSKPSNQSPMQNGTIVSGPKPRLCYLVKDGGYGFSLKTLSEKKGLCLVDVAQKKVADKAGVQENDHLIEVNGQNVETATHEQVVAKIKESGDRLFLLVADGEVVQFYANKKIRIRGEMASVKHLPFQPREVELSKGSDGYGFFLRLERGRKGHFIKDIDPGTPAEKAGLKDDDRLVAVNGDNVESTEHDDVVEKIRKCGNKTKLLIVDKKADELFQKAGISPMVYWNEVQEPSPDYVMTEVPPYPEEDQMKYKPKLCFLEKSPVGYGFHMNAIRGTLGQFIKEVSKGSPAEKAGLEDDDIVVEVNGVNVENMAHEDAVLEVRKTKGKLSMLVASKDAYNYFKANKIPITAALAVNPTSDIGNVPATPLSAANPVAIATAAEGPAARSVAPAGIAPATEVTKTEDISNNVTDLKRNAGIWEDAETEEVSKVPNEPRSRAAEREDVGAEDASNEPTDPQSSVAAWKAAVETDNESSNSLDPYSSVAALDAITDEVIEEPLLPSHMTPLEKDTVADQISDSPAQSISLTSNVTTSDAEKPVPDTNESSAPPSSLKEKSKVTDIPENNKNILEETKEKNTSSADAAAIAAVAAAVADHDDDDDKDNDDNTQL
ncbi:Na(+)/H(+) exchange regulatory cofactor NHE-RF3 [Protopterus annectens]|uniref:Na(+)/H(+) exchange regulatory cofactor NHE-RF3 n=1 Tax=Protopterus annectens TaxID=7888 RepID=UPI001CFB69B1|nr:Na(+)/H(+) exchange regulatory cofactor NHE-RF3 [Protopterus annectens]